jgi:chemotaxis protein CheC
MSSAGQSGMTEDPPVALDEMERDALAEVINIGVSRAASSLRIMVGREILLTVPDVAILPCGRAEEIIGDHRKARLVAVRQDFDGDFSGRAMLIFPETNSLELVRAVTGGALPLEDVVALEQEALAETGNIILNNCLATVANILKRTLRTSLPDLFRGNGAELFGLAATSGPDDVVLVIHINFTVNTHEITGYIAMLMALPALRILKGLLNELVDRTTVS